MRSYIYDIEVMHLDWIVIFKEVGSGKYDVFHNDNMGIKEWIDLKKDDILYGFNNKHYDDYILKSMYYGAPPKVVKKLNDFIIVDHGQGWEFPFLQYKKKAFHTADLRDDIPDMGLSLKAIEGNLNLSIVESSVDFNIGRKLTDEELEETILYCKKDVDATERLYQERIEYINAKKLIGEMYQVDVRKALGMTNAKLCAEIMHAEPKDFDDERDYEIPDAIDRSRIPKPIMDFFSQIWDESIPDVELWKRSFNFVFRSQAGECPCTYAWGGAHGAKPCYVAEATEDILIENYDVGSLYPNSALNFGFTSRTTKDPNAYKKLVSTRLAYKHEGNKPKSNALKLPINTYYGAMLNQYNPLADPKMGRSICITNQLAMTNLIVRLAEECPSFDLINYNTDGIMYHISRADQEKCHRIVDEWCGRTGFEMELDPPIKKIIQKDVNNYIELRADGHYKCKGSYVNIIDGGTFRMNSLRIVQRAVVENLIYGTSIEQTILEADEIHDFQMICKTGGSYEKCIQVINGEDAEVNKVNRVYASDSPLLGTLYKVKYTKGVERRDKIANLPEHCIVDNDNRLTIDQIDRSYYIQMAKNRIRDYTVIKKAVTKKIEKMEVIEIMATTKKATEIAPDLSAVTKEMNVFQRLNLMRVDFLNIPKEKSGKNKFAGFKYFNLDDIVIPLIPLFVKCGLVLEPITFHENHATAILRSVDEPDDLIEFQTSLIDLDVRAKGMNSVQAQGAIETYATKRLLNNLLLIAENDTLDAISGDPKNVSVEEIEKEAAEKKEEKKTQDDFMNIPEDANEEEEMLTPKTQKAIKDALKKLREIVDDEKYIKDCILKMKSPTFYEKDGQKLLVEITNKL